MKTAILTVLACAAILPALHEASALSPMPPTVVVYDLDANDDLPMFNGDLDSVKIEVLSGSEYAWQHWSDLGPCAYNVTMNGELQLVIDALGGELFQFDKWTISEGPFTGTGPASITTGALTYDVSGTPSRTITSDTRCDSFEGTGTVDLDWNVKQSATVAGTGCNFGPQMIAYSTLETHIRVTYTLK
jgi:hypothetical protein